MTTAMARQVTVVLTVMTIGVASNVARGATPIAEQDADLAFDRKDWAAAAAAYESVTRAGTEKPRPYLRLGIARHQLKQFKEATAAYEKALALGTLGTQLAHYNLACIYARTDTKQAFTHLEAAMRSGASTQQIESDPDLATLRKDARYPALRDKLERESHPCKYEAVYRGFDFWLGDWDVMAGSSRAGQSRIESAADGCLLVENWTDANGHGGKSLNFFHAREQRWRQTWVGADGEVVEFHGVLVAGEGDTKEMRFSASGTDKSGKPWERRLTFAPKIEGGVRKVRQFGERSDDGGRTFIPEYDLLYVPRGKQ